MTITTKHSTRRQLQTANATVEQARARNNVLRDRFPPRPTEAWWPATAQSADEVLRRLTAPPFSPAANATRAGRRRGVAKLLRWLSSLPGDTWQQRWKASRAEEIPGAAWTDFPLRFLRQSGPSPSYERVDLTSGMLMLVCGDVIRPDLAWMLSRRAVAPKAAGHLTWAEETSTGQRRNLTYEESEAFWAFAAIEVLRLTGIRNEELLELTLHSITEYRLPTTGEVVPLLQVAPSKTDSERLLLVSPELADILSTIIRRLRGSSGAIPLGDLLRRPRAGLEPRRCRCCSSAISAPNTALSPRPRSASF